MKRVMVICGGDWQVDLVKKVKQMGHYVVNTNLYSQSPAFKFADAYEVADVLDMEKNLSIANKYHPDAVLTDQSDIAVPTVAYIAQTLGLPGISQPIAERFTNKYIMRQICRTHGFAHPDFALCNSLQQALSFQAQHGRVVIKPLDSQSSRGVHLIDSASEMRVLFPKALQYSRNQSAVLVEQFLQGTEFTVEGLKTNWGHTSLAVSKKQHYLNFPMVAASLHYSHQDAQFDYPKLRQLNDCLAEKMELPFGLTHAEYIWCNGDFHLVEIAARGGGTNIASRIVPFMSGVSTYDYLIKMALGETVSPLSASELLPFQHRECHLGFFDLSAGTVTSVQGTEKLMDHPNVLDWRLNFRVGDAIGAPSDDSQRPGHYILGAENALQMEELRRWVDKEVQFQYAEGN